jgi:hypothetical protein
MFAVATVAILLAPPARADGGGDIEFLAALARQNIDCGPDFPCPNGPSDLEAMGHMFCGKLDEGVTAIAVAAQAPEATNGTLGEAQGHAVVSAAIEAYCPQYKNELS